MENNELSLFEWHDLPLDCYVITDSAIHLLISPFDEEIQDYQLYELVLSDFKLCHMVCDMELKPNSLKNMDVTNFDYEVSGDRVSGIIEIYPANTGCFTLKLEDSRFDLRLVLKEK